MTAYLGRRVVGLLVTLFLISIAVFAVLTVIPGDPAQMVLGADADPAAYQATRVRLGLDRPAVSRYLAWLARAVRGDLGRSLYQERPVSSLIGARLGLTAALTAFATLLALIVGIPLGTFAATHHGRAGDLVGRLLVQAGMIVPEFWVGILLVLVFSILLHWFPAGGFPGWSAGGAVAALLLPAVALSLPRAAVLGRMTRASLLEVLEEPYIAVARAKGLSGFVVLYKHALKNALIALVTVLGLLVAQLVAGSIIIESVFYLPGLGRLVVQAIGERDLPVVQGAIIVAAFLIALVNFGVDLIYGFLDPRVRYR